MKHIFGCANTETGEFYNQEVDGIIGFGSNTYEETKGDPPNILQTERLEGRIKSLVFSICLGHNGGEMTFGDWNKYLHLDKDQGLSNQKSNPNRVKAHNVDLHEDHRFILTNSFEEEDPWKFQYKVPLLGIDFDGEHIPYPYEKMNKGELSTGEGAFFDTGTTYMYTSHKMFREIKKRFTRFCDKDLENCGGESRWEECYSIDDDQKGDMDAYFRSFPMMTFNFAGNKPYRWYPSDYLIKNGDLDQYCVGIKPLKDMILGAVFMRNYDILFDKTRKLIGFARSDCNGTGTVHYYDYKGNDILKKIPKAETPQVQNTAAAAHVSHKHSKRHKSHSKKEHKDEENSPFSTFGYMMILSVVIVLLALFFKCFIMKLKKKEKELDAAETETEEGSDHQTEAVIVDTQKNDEGVSQKGKLD